jgi:hypothetical protein
MWSLCRRSLSLVDVKLPPTRGRIGDEEIPRRRIGFLCGRAMPGNSRLRKTLALCRIQRVGGYYYVVNTGSDTLDDDRAALTERSRSLGHYRLPAGLEGITAT